MNDFTLLTWIIVALVIAGLWWTATQSKRKKRHGSERRSTDGAHTGTGIGIDGSAPRSKRHGDNDDSKKGWWEKFTDGDFDGGGCSGDGGGD